VTQGMRNKDIAQEVVTTEQVVEELSAEDLTNKLGVSDRLELALYCMHHRLLENYSKPSAAPADGNAAAEGTGLAQ